MGDSFDAKLNSSFSLGFDPMSYTLKDSSSPLDEFDPLHPSNLDIQADSLEPLLTKPSNILTTEDSLDFEAFEDGNESLLGYYEDDDDEENPECNVESEESDLLNEDAMMDHSSEGLISVAKLKTTYTQNAREQSFSTPTKETIETGIKIANIKSTLGSPPTGEIPKENDFLSTGISVRSLTSSFTTRPNRDDEVISPAISPIEEFQLSVDKEQLALKFSQNGHEDLPLCKICRKVVYQMEKISAEKSAFHKLCFRCTECKKTLTVDTYSSHNGHLYCKPHFRALFQPQAKFKEQESINNSTEDSIIKENVPQVLSPDVVRSDCKSDDGIENIPDLSNLRSKFEYSPSSKSPINNASQNLNLTAINKLEDRMAKYNSCVDGVEEAMAEEIKEKPIPVNLTSLKTQWESGSITSGAVLKEDRTDELQELEQLKPILHSESFKSMYENACQEANKTVTSKSELVELSEETKRLRDKFEKGELKNELDTEKFERAKKEKEDDLSYTASDTNISFDARNIFMQIDAAGAKPPTPTSPVKFQEFNKLNSSTPKEKTRNGSLNGSDSVDAEIVRASDSHEEIPMIDTTKRVLGWFQSLESNPDTDKNNSFRNEESIQVEVNLTKNLKGKFENWENVSQENKKNEDQGYSQKSLTKNLRAMFEVGSRDEETSSLKEKPKNKVNRFIEQQASLELCAICQKKLYPMEKMETSGLRIHKNCFRCVHCSCILRLENYTTSGGKLYCTPHFKQLFISKGNYDEGFGREQHKDKWNRSRSNTPVSTLDQQVYA